MNGYDWHFVAGDEWADLKERGETDLRMPRGWFLVFVGAICAVMVVSAPH